MKWLDASSALRHVNYSNSLEHVTYFYTFIFNVDINECALSLDDCHQFATCTNTVGSFECRCNIGYEGDGVNCRGIYFECLHGMVNFLEATLIVRYLSFLR